MMKQLFGGLFAAIGFHLVSVGVVWIGDNIDGQREIIKELREMATTIEGIISTSKTIKKGE